MSRELGSRIVYVIGTGDSPVKIGLAERIKIRLTQLQVGCPDLLTVHHITRVPWQVAETIEARAHAALAEHHRRGEWFNVDKAVAAATVERIKRQVLPEYQWSIRKDDGDLFARLASRYELRRDARAAVWEYRDIAGRGLEGYIGHANGYVLKTAGMAAYAVFSLVIAQQKNLDSLTPRQRGKAEGHLATALNRLCEFRDEYRRRMSAAAFAHEVKTMLAPDCGPSTRPPSLPPLPGTKHAAVRYRSA